MDPVHDRRSNDGPGYLFLNSFSSRVRAMTGNTSGLAGIITLLPEIKKVIYMAHHFNYCLK